MLSVGVRNIEIGWQPPSENIDGSSLNNLAGYRIYQVVGTSRVLQKVVDSPTAASVSIAMPPGTFDFVITAFDTEGDESSESNMVRKTSP